MSARQLLRGKFAVVSHEDDSEPDDEQSSSSSSSVSSSSSSSTTSPTTTATSSLSSSVMPPSAPSAGKAAAALRSVAPGAARKVAPKPKRSAATSLSANKGERLPEPSQPQHSLAHAYQTYLKHDVQERNHFDDVCQSFRMYATFAMAQWANHQYRLHSLGEDQRALLPPALRRDTPEFHTRARQYKDAAIRNQFLLDCILRHAGQPHSQDAVLQNKKQKQPNKARKAERLRTNASGSSNAGADGSGPIALPAQQQPQPPSDSQMAKVSSVLKCLVRDWSKEGQNERDQAYRPLLDLVQVYVPLPDRHEPAAGASSPQPSPSRPTPRLCVPGAGVGRLALELAALGYEVQGNELSLHMLLASDFVLNGGVATPDRPMRISPYLLETRNVHSADDTTRAILIPDVDPYSLLVKEEDGGGDGAAISRPPQPEFSMAAGEFVSIYSAPREKEMWNGVVACFFLDNAPCVVEYLQVIYDMLVPGGVLLHFGPLLWHWSGPAYRPDDASVEDYRNRYHDLDPKYMSSVDLCWEDVQGVLANIGFELVESKTGQRANYTCDSRSMMSVEYKCLQFVARKPFKADKGCESSQSSKSWYVSQCATSFGNALSSLPCFTCEPSRKGMRLPSVDLCVLAQVSVRIRPHF